MAGLESNMRKVVETVELAKGDDFVIVEFGSRAHEHFAALEYMVVGEVAKSVEEKVKPKRRAKDQVLAQI